MSRETKQKEAARLAAVREAYWVGTEPEYFERSVLRDALVLAEIVAKPLLAQVKALFMMLPGTIIGQGIAWGLDDTEVRGSIHRFVDENREAVREAATV
jgi:hypothetical protein